MMDMKRIFIYVLMLAQSASLYCMQSMDNNGLPDGLSAQAVMPFINNLGASVNKKNVEEIKKNYTALIKHLSAFEQNPYQRYKINSYKTEALEIVLPLISHFKDRHEIKSIESLESIFVDTQYYAALKAIIKSFADEKCPTSNNADNSLNASLAPGTNVQRCKIITNDQQTLTVDKAFLEESSTEKCPTSNNADNSQNATSLPTGANAQSCKIITNDQQTLTVNMAFLEYSSTLKNLRTDLGDVDSIELPDGTPLTAQKLSKIIELKDRAKGNRESLTAAINTLEIDALLEIIKGANYLDLSDLLDVGLKAFAAKLSINDIENYLGKQPILPKELMQRLLKLIGATNCLVYRSSFDKPLKRINDKSPFAGGYLKSAKFMPGTSLLIIWAGTAAYLFDCNANKEVTDLSKKSDFLNVIPFSSYCPLFTASLLATGFRNVSSTQFELSDLKDINKRPRQFSYPYFCSPVCLSSEGNLVAIHDQDSKICLFNIDFGFPRILPKAGLPTLSPDGSLIFIKPKINSADDDKTCCLYDIKADQINHSFIDIKSKFYTPCFSPDSSLIAIGCDNGVTYLWDIKAKSYKNILDAKKNERVTSLYFSADGGLIAIGFIDGTVTVSDVATGKCLCSFAASASCEKNSGIPCSLFFNSDKTVLVVNLVSKTENAVTIWDLNSSICIYTLKSERAVLEGFNSDYSLISGFDDRQKCVGIWAIDKNLEHYLYNEIKVDQSLLLIPIFKAILNNSKISITNNKLKAIYESITNEKLKKLISSYISFEDTSKRKFEDTSEQNNTDQKKHKQK